MHKYQTYLIFPKLKTMRGKKMNNPDPEKAPQNKKQEKTKKEEKK